MTLAETAARAHLAEQIANHNAIEGELAKTQTALVNAKHKLGGMLDEADQADARKAAEQDAEIDRILSGAPKAKGASLAPVPTEGDIALQRRLIVRLEALETEHEYALAAAKRAVAAGVSAVVAARVHELAPEFEKVRAEFAKLAAQFSAARSAIEFDRDAGSPYGRVDSILREEPGSALRFAGLAPGEEGKCRAAIERLARDPNVPLH
jgi:hypothetical protein